MGPQQTLFVPFSAIKKVHEKNRVMLFEVDGLSKDSIPPYIEFVDKPIWKD